MRKFLIILLLFICSCQEHTFEFSYPEYLGHWRDSISATDFWFSQSELYVGNKKYQFWEVENDTLKLTEEALSPPSKIYLVIKNPYITPKYEWKMILDDGVKYYLKRI